MSFNASGSVDLFYFPLFSKHCENFRPKKKAFAGEKSLNFILLKFRLQESLFRLIHQFILSLLSRNQND